MFHTFGAFFQRNLAILWYFSLGGSIMPTLVWNETNVLVEVCSLRCFCCYYWRFIFCLSCIYFHSFSMLPRCVHKKKETIFVDYWSWIITRHTSASTHFLYYYCIFWIFAFILPIICCFAHGRDVYFQIALLVNGEKQNCVFVIYLVYLLSTWCIRF